MLHPWSKRMCPTQGRIVKGSGNTNIRSRVVSSSRVFIAKVALLLGSFYRTDTIRAILDETGIAGGPSLCTLWWALTYHFETVGLCKVKVP